MNWRYDEIMGGNGEMAGGAYHFLGATADEVSEPVDVVNKPPHYNQGGVQAIEGIEAALGELFEGYLAGNCMKYLWRYRHKNGLQDLEKASWYLDKLRTVVSRR